MPRHSLSLIAVPDIPLVVPDDDLAAVLMEAMDRGRVTPANQDVLVVAQKIVSKAEGRYVDLSEVLPSEQARRLSKAVDKDPRLVELILTESEEVIRYKPGVLVVAHRIGVVLANAGIDHSNVDPSDGGERVLLLPRNPDASAAALKAQLEAHYAIELGVIISDSVGRAWRNGTVGIALGAAGLPALCDLTGRADLFGRPLQTTQTGFADELASAASLLMGQADEGLPAVLICGLEWQASDLDTRALQRPKEQDLFR